MTYVPNKTWAEGQTLAASHLNHIESGLANVSSSFISVKEAPYNAKGDGATNDTAAIQAALTAAAPPGEIAAVYFPPGEYFISAALKVPELVTMFSTNRRATVLVAHGEFSLLEVTGTGDIAIHGLFLKCAAPQTVKGAAIDLSKGFVNRCTISDVQIGSNFFNGFNIVPSTSCSNVYIKDVLFEEYTGGVEKFGNAAFVIGSSTQRVFIVNIINVTGTAKKQADMPKWFKIQNTDSLFMSTCGFQNGLQGINIGEGDTSSQGTTNLNLSGVWVDGGPEGMGAGYYLNSCFSADFTGCHAQGCSPGVFVVGDVIATWTGGKVYHNYGSGFSFTASMKGGSSFQIADCTIADNCEAKGAAVSEQCGVYAAKKASGWTITGSAVGNFAHYGGGFQKYGVYVEGENKNYSIVGNRIPKTGVAGEAEGWNLTKGIEDKGEASKVIANNLES